MSSLAKLAEWYLEQCDGLWEHHYWRISLKTLDNPGFFLEINLLGTPLEHKPFAEVRLDCDSETHWIHCSVKDHQFIGGCSADRIDETIDIFLGWAHEGLQ